MYVAAARPPTCYIPSELPLRISKAKFRLKALIAAVTLCAVTVWLWPIWERHRAVRMLVKVVEGKVPKTNEPVEAAVEEVNRLRASELAFESLERALDHPDYSVRYNALIALRRVDLEAEVKVPLFVQVLTDDDKLPLTDDYETFVRCTAAGSLALLGDRAKRAVSALNGALRNDCPRVGDSALYALQPIDPASIAPDASTVHTNRKKLFSSPETNLTYHQLPLVDVVEDIGLAAAVAISVDWTGLYEHEITKFTPVSFQASEISYGQALQQIVSGVHATCEITPTGVLIKPEREQGH